MTWAPYEYQKRVYELLNAHVTLAGKVFDRIPDQKVFPYLQIMAETEFEDRGSHTTEGWTGRLFVHVFSRAHGRKETNDLLAIVDGLLHNKELAVNGWCELSFRRDLTTIIVEDDNVTFHGVLRFKLLTGEG